MNTFLIFFKWFLLVISILGIGGYITKVNKTPMSQVEVKKEKKNISSVITFTILIWIISFIVSPVKKDLTSDTSESIAGTEHIEKDTDYLNDTSNIEYMIESQLHTDTVKLNQVRKMNGDNEYGLDLIFDIDSKAVNKKNQINKVTYDILSEINQYDYSFYNEISFYYRTILLDKYGNEKDYLVGKVRFYKETLDKMNIENLNLNNIETVADKYWLFHVIDK